MDRIEILEQEIEKVKERNRKVEADKAWERSLIRLLAISVITYIVAAAALYFIHVPDFYLSALVPVIGFVLSTQSLPFVKGWWIKRHRASRK